MTDAKDSQHFETVRIPSTPDRLVVRIPQSSHDASEGAKYYDPEKKWLGVDWPNGMLTVHILTDEESERWLRGEDIQDPEPKGTHHAALEE